MQEVIAQLQNIASQIKTQKSKLDGLKVQKDGLLEKLFEAQADENKHMTSLKK